MASPDDSGGKQATIPREATAGKSEATTQGTESGPYQTEQGRDEVVAEAALDLIFGAVSVFLGIMGIMFAAAAFAFPNLITQFGILSGLSLGMIGAVVAMRKLISTTDKFYRH